MTCFCTSIRSIGLVSFGGLETARHEFKSFSDCQNSKLLIRFASTGLAVIAKSRHPGALRAPSTKSLKFSTTSSLLFGSTVYGWRSRLWSRRCRMRAALPTSWLGRLSCIELAPEFCGSSATRISERPCATPCRLRTDPADRRGAQSGFGESGAPYLSERQWGRYSRSQRFATNRSTGSFACPRFHTPANTSPVKVFPSITKPPHFAS